MKDLSNDTFDEKNLILTRKDLHCQTALRFLLENSRSSSEYQKSLFTVNIISNKKRLGILFYDPKSIYFIPPMVMEISPNTFACELGLQPGDILIAVNNTCVERYDPDKAINFLLSCLKEGGKVQIQFLRPLKNYCCDKE